MYKSNIIIILAAWIHSSNMEYIPPGPTYPCPKETDKHLLFPCVCENGTDTGLFVRCENVGLAAASVGIGNIAGLGLPIEKLTLKNFKVSHLYGPIFHRSTIKVLNIENSPIKTIDEYTFAGVNRTLRELYISGTELEEFPKDAFKILGNLTILVLDGHKISSLGKDIFVGSEAAGKLERLHITNGVLSEFAPETFQYLKKLRTLDLHGNNLANLKKNQFKGLREAEVLDLSYNKITKLDGSHIGDLTKLGWCNVSHNQIGDIPRGMFARNTVLKVVHLDNNRIKKLDTNSFRGMRFLRRLYLQDNAIEEVGRGTFAAVTRIGTVNLARNKITKVDFQMFQQVKYAELIDLSENAITIIEKQAFTDLYLATVNISHNALSEIEPGAFVNCNNMTLLDLSHNRLENIHKMAFDVNSYAFEFQVSFNLFTDLIQIPIGNMSGLHKLNASHNAIERVPRNSIPKLFELNAIDLSYNNLSEIFNAIFQNLFSLRYLNLSHNSLTQIKPGTFGTLSTVLEVDLSHNMLSDVSKGSLAKLASCRVLDVSYNMMDKIFQIPISLGELNFAHNRLTEIPSNTWPSMNALLSLNLSSNRLTDSLQSDSFGSLLTLQRVDLSSNAVSRPPWEALNALSSLQYLYLQNNSLTSLSRTAFGNLPTLFELDLSHNAIETVAPMAFGGLQQLQTLSLRGNELESIHNEAFKSLVALTKLDLSHNQIEKINNKTHGLLDECLSIETVDDYSQLGTIKPTDGVILSHNKFSTITKKTFPANKYIPYKLFDVDLSYNQLPVLTHDATYGTKRLKRFNVSNNYLFEIRNTVLGNMSSLEVLDLSNNNLKNLNSFNSDATVQLPQSITKIYLQNNKLEILPIDEIVNKTQLSLLDIRNNELSNFSPKFVKKIKQGGFDVYFEGNPLKCDCQTRPLKHYLNKKSTETIQKQQIYTNITCSKPTAIENENLLTIDEERLVCSNGDSQNGGGESNMADNFDFVSEPDIVIRDLQHSQSTIQLHWYILSIEDIADFYILIRNQNNTVIYSNNVAYNLRSHSITIDKEIKMALENGGRFELCILPKSSNGSTKKWYQSQCKFLPDNYSSWPKKVSNDKRRLSKKRTYSWFGSNALGLVSDSILITLCIFLGVCFRRMAELEHF